MLAVSPGEYEVNVHQAGYVDQNWFTESKEDSFYPSTVYLTAETTTKKAYLFAPAAELKPLTFEELNPMTNTHKPAKALNAVLENPGMAPTFRLLEPEGSSTYLSSITTTKRIYPFSSKAPYTVYAGTCTANKPPEEKERTSIEFPAGGEQSAKVVLPSLVVDVWQGTKREAKRNRLSRNLSSSPPKSSSLTPTMAAKARIIN